MIEVIVVVGPLCYMLWLWSRGRLWSSCYVAQSEPSHPDCAPFEAERTDEPDDEPAVRGGSNAETASVRGSLPSDEVLRTLAQLEVNGAVSRSAAYVALGVKRGRNAAYDYVSARLNTLTAELRGTPDYTTPIAGRPTRKEHFPQQEHV
jgi:hypothetical protein